MRSKLFLGDQKINNIETYKIILLKPFKDISFEYDKIIFGYVEDSKLIEEVKGKENNIVFYTEVKLYLIILKLYLENFIIPYNHHLIQIFNQYFSDKVINNKNNFLLFINKKIRNNTIVSVVNYENKVNKDDYNKEEAKFKGEKKIKYFDINNNKFYTIEDKKDVLKFINNYNKKQLTKNDTYYKVEPLLQNFRPLVLMQMKILLTI